MERYQVLEMVGEGSFGRVYKGRRKQSGQVVALKFIPKVGRLEKELKNLVREIDIMRGLRHPNIVRMLDSFETEKEVVVVTDYAEGELFQILEDDGNLPEEQVQDIACQLVSALYYLHSHRILHRDMKPQNILLGKGGVVKLCDFGFARSMSIHTLVLTSIKGTPLYMSPELVEEKPYDHTSDLWSMGCILYELFVGTPPFYTNSIFQLVSLIIKDPVKWPKNMSAPFKSFLQGLLTKDPRQRLSWPALLYHPFIAGRVTVVDDTAEQGIQNPFTVQLPPELQQLKEEQVHSLAPKSGQSKILRKARQKMAEQAKKKEQMKAEAAPSDCTKGGKQASASSQGRHAPKSQPPPEEILLKDKDPSALTPDSPAADFEGQRSRKEWEMGVSPPTPREHRITQDYEREFPEVEVGGRGLSKTTGAGSAQGRRSIERVDLENEEVDSDDEWRHLIDATEPSNLQLTTPLTLLGDPAFIQRIRLRLQGSCTQVLEGMLEGASHLRPALHVVGNLLATKCDSDLLHSFCQEVDLPQFILRLIDQILDSASIKQQPWCLTVLSDLLAVLTAFFTSDFNLEKSQRGNSLQVFQQAADYFLSLLGKLLSQPIDTEMVVREQSIMCLIFLCEAMDSSSASICRSFYSNLLSEHQTIMDRILREAQPSGHLMSRGTVHDGGDRRETRERQVAISTAALAAICTFPPGLKECRDVKEKVSQYAAETILASSRRASRSFFVGFQQPALALNTLRVVYSCCHVSLDFCRSLERDPQALDLLMVLLQGKVPMPDDSRVQATEIALHLFSLVVFQLQTIPAQLVLVAPVINSLFLESSIASIASGAGLLLVQLLQHGAELQFNIHDVLDATKNVLNAPPELHSSPPMGTGLYDGIVLLLLQLLSEADPAVIREFSTSELWKILWHCLASVLHLCGERPIMEGETPRPGQPSPEPDWHLISSQGTVVFLSLALFIFTREPHQCLSLLAHPKSVIMATLNKVLSQDFLIHLTQICSQPSGLDNCETVPSVVLQTCQLLCFPFAIDLEHEMMLDILVAVRDLETPMHLLQVCCHHLPLTLAEVPMSLLCRLVLSDEAFVLQFAEAASSSEAAVGFLSSVLLSDHNLLNSDLLALLTHLARASPTHLPLLQRILGGPDAVYKPLQHLLHIKEEPIRAKACGLVGNMLRHGQEMNKELLAQPGLLEKLLDCLSDEDGRVRRSASFAVGNAAYQGGSLAQSLATAVPGIIRLLGDSQAKTRGNAASALGNLGMHSEALGELLIQNRAPQLLLEAACHDPVPAVHEASLIALRSLGQQPKIHQVLVSLRASEKLTAFSQNAAVRRSQGSPQLSSMHHCKKLIHLLRHTQSA